MGSTTDALKRTFREGRHTDAVSQCEAALARRPQDRELQRLCATMHAMTGGHARALELLRALRALRDPAREDGDLLFDIGNCEKELRDFAAAARTFESYTRSFPADAGDWSNLAHCRFELGAYDEGGRAATQAMRRRRFDGYQDRVKVLSRPSHAVKVGTDLPAKADILLHEVYSSELLGEHVLPAIEDAKARLLKPGGQVLPSAPGIMVALLGGEALGKNLHVGESFGFDLGEFNAIHPRKRPLYREDLEPELLSAPIEAFRFDFMRQSAFPAERKQTVRTWHDRSRPWFALAGVA